MEQDKLKILLKSIINEIENDQLTTIDEIIMVMLQEFQELSLAFNKDIL